MTLTKDSVLWNGLPQSGNIASPTFGEKIHIPLNLSLDLHLSNMSVIILFHPVSNFNTLRHQFESGKTQKMAGRRLSVAIRNTKVTIAITIIQV
jgi:hypothetical protein